MTKVYQHLGQAPEAYNESKDFFGDLHKEQLDPFDRDYVFGQKRYDAIQQEFLGIAIIGPALLGFTTAVDTDVMFATGNVTFPTITRLSACPEGRLGRNTNRVNKRS